MLDLSKYPVQKWSEFFEFERFGKPDLADLEHLTARVSANWEYYSGNYIWVLRGMALLAGVMNGDLLVYYAVFGALYLSFIDIVYFDIFFYNYSYYFAFVGRTEPIKIGDYQLTVQQQFGVLGCIVIAAFYAHGWLILKFLSYGALAIVVHSCLRKRSVKSKVNFALRSNSSTSITSSLNKVADKIVNAGEEIKLTESVRYEPSVFKSLRSRSSQNLQ